MSQSSYFNPFLNISSIIQLFGILSENSLNPTFSIRFLQYISKSINIFRMILLISRTTKTIIAAISHIIFGLRLTDRFFSQKNIYSYWCYHSFLRCNFMLGKNKQSKNSIAFFLLLNCFLKIYLYCSNMLGLFKQNKRCYQFLMKKILSQSKNILIISLNFNAVF